MQFGFFRDNSIVIIIFLKKKKKKKKSAVFEFPAPQFQNLVLKVLTIFDIFGAAGMSTRQWKSGN